MHRNAAIGLLLAVTLATGGCVQVVSGGPIEFEATPAGVSDAALQETGYQAEQQEEYRVEQRVTVPVLGEREVRISNHVATYAGAGEDGSDDQRAQSVGVFLVLSTPQAQVAGQGTNPLGRMPVEELVEQVGSRAGDQSDVQHVESRDVTVLGTSTTAEKFSSTTRAEGETVETYIYVVRVGHGEDYVIGVGVLPKQFEDSEETIYRLMRGLEHEAAG